MPKININERPVNFNEQKVRILSLAITSACNLSCMYCYEKHELRDKKIMDFLVAKKAICDSMEEEGFDLLEIHFFGGEPLIAFPLIKEVIDWFPSRSWEKKHRFLIGTNGTILTEEIKEWLYKHRECISVALSLDGTKKAHDLSRSNSYDSIRANLPFFQEYWSKQPAKMTICADTIPYAADGIIELEEMGLMFTANIGFEDQWGDEANKFKLLETYEDQLSRLVDYYSDNAHLFPVSPMLTAVPEYLGIPSLYEDKEKENKRFCGAGHEMSVIDVDGKKYPCHRFIPWVTNRPAPEYDVNCQSAWKPDKCAQCRFIPSCPTCAGYNWEIHGDTGIRSTFHCESFKLEVMASCLIEFKRLRRQFENIDTLEDEQKRKMRMRLDAIWELIENGV